MTRRLTWSGPAAAVPHRRAGRRSARLPPASSPPAAPRRPRRLPVPARTRAAPVPAAAGSRPPAPLRRPARPGGSPHTSRCPGRARGRLAARSCGSLVLFLDEPTTGLDPESRRRTWMLLRELLVAGTTVVLTTHYLEEAEELADRLAIMHQGRIVRTGTPAQVAASQPARISFELPEDSREPVPDIAGTRASVTGRTVLLQTADLQPTLTALLGWANSRGLVLGALDARPASLAEAFHAVAASAGSPADDGNAKDVAA